jgi:type IV conjugative transfer system coupling protein TraD
MKRNLANFTRGSQLLGHFGFMFAAGLKGPAIVALIVVCWTSWWLLSGQLTDQETYLVWMRVYAAAFTWMEFDPHKEVVLQTASGGSVHLPMAMVRTWPSVARAWAHMWQLLRTAFEWSALFLVPAFIVFYWFAARFGRKARERKHERGPSLVELPELVEEIRQHNRQERNRERDEAMGWRWRLCRPSELAAVFPYRPSRLAGVSYPWRLEQSHAMLIGTTGMGKTVALSEMIAEARQRGERAVIFDLTGAFIESFYDPSRDVILNPLDARCPQWSVFDECRDEAEFTAAAEALVPHDGGGSEQFWVLAARLLFVEMCLKLRARGQGTNDALARELMTADLARVHQLMRGTIADPLTAPEAARMAESIRAVFNANAKALKLLPRQGRHFSVRDWVEDGEAGGGIVFISARYVDMSVCSQLLTVWLDTAMNTLMTLERTRDLRIWFFIDEMGALHRLPALEKGLQTARNFGGAIVTGIHAYAKLKEVYGDNMAMTLSSLARTKLILGTADRDTATWCSDFIGHTQVRDMEEGYTYGYNNARDAVSLTSRKHIEPLLLPDQLMNLPRLVGYLKFPDGFPAAKVRLLPKSRPRRAEAFIRRAVDRPAIDPSQPRMAAPAGAGDGTAQGASPASAPPSANDDGVGKRVVPRQGELALEPREMARQEGGSTAEHVHPETLPSASADVVLKSVGDPAGGTEPETGINSPAAVPMPGSMRGEGGDEQARPTSPGAGRDVGAGQARGQSDGRPDNPSAVPPGVVPRKLMLDDGLPEQGRDDVQPGGYGDLDHDM